METIMSIGRIILTGSGAYVSIILILRISGKRTLTKMNAFDFIVTVSLGSILAITLTNRNVSLLDGLTAYGTLIILQYIVAQMAQRVEGVHKLIRSTPTLLYYKRKYKEHNLRKERILKEEVVQAIRSSGKEFEEVDAVVLEADGSFSVLTNADHLLEGVQN